MNFFSPLKPPVLALVERLLGAMAKATCLGGGVLCLASAGVARVVDLPEIPRGGIQRVLYELDHTESIVAESLLGALIVSGPKGYGQLLNLAQGAPIDGIEPFGRTTQLQVLDALRGIPSVVRMHLLDANLSPRRVDVESKLALRILGDIGSASDLPMVLNYLTTEGEEAVPLGQMTSAGVLTIEKLLERDRRSFEVLASLYPGLEVRLRATVLRAVGGTPSKGSLAFLERLLGKEDELEVALFGEIGRVAEAAWLAPDSRTLTLIQSKLYSRDLVLLRQSCLTLGRLGDAETVGDLIDLLEHEDKGVAANAHWALEHITAKKLQPDSARWRKWLRAETAWWEDRSYGVLERLQGGDAGDIGAALRELSGHGLHRAELALEVSLLLNHENTSLVAQACAVLEALASSVAVVPLQELIQRGPDASTPHAERALVRSLAKR